MQVGVSLGTQPPLRRIRATAAVARLLRVDSLWTVDHFLGFVPQVLWNADFSWLASPGSSPHVYYDYQALMGYMARRVGNVQLAVGVTEPIRRHPVVLAQTFMTLSHLTKRAPILGIGAGERENIEPYGLDFERPVARLEEALAVIRLCFENCYPIDFDGEFYRLSQARMELRPAAGRAPEIWIAAHGPRMLRLTGRYGDGWYPAVPMEPAEYATALARIHAAARAAGRAPGAIVPGAQIPFVVAPTEAEARRMLEHPSIRFFGLLVPDYVWQQYGLTHPLGEGFGGMVDFIPDRYSRGELEDALAQVPTEPLGDRIVWGTSDQVVAKIRALGEAGLRHVVLAPMSALTSKKAAAYSLRSLPGIMRRLRSSG